MIRAYEMANLNRKDSGQPFDICWVDSMGKQRYTKHNEPLKIL